MTWVIHTLGPVVWFALGLGAIAGILAWIAPKILAGVRGRDAPGGSRKVVVAAGATVALAVSILQVAPGSGRRFPAQGLVDRWQWRWLGDIPDALTIHLLNDYTAAIAMLNFVLFAVWGVVVAWAWGPRRRRWALVSIALFPVGLEALQRYPFGGTPSGTDAWTNILGGLFGLLTLSMATRIFAALRRSPVTP